ncbi:hypothetical protein E3N88_34794 [Mikania micrantha]|uniref:Uncharacterized protein n=1 Tax=Mikania micrantha TaxID=192012 RepID=A0A5N6LZ60_9ASTR|nr:hypothetical protein E3N88_34794 [Mikania micrantha]
MSQQQPPTPTFSKLSDPPVTQTHYSSPFTTNTQSLPTNTKPTYVSSTFHVPPPITTRFEQGGFSGAQEKIEFDEDFEPYDYEDDTYVGPYASYDDGTSFGTNDEQDDWEFLEKMAVITKRKARSQRRSRHSTVRVVSNAPNSDRSNRDEPQGRSVYESCGHYGELGHIVDQCPSILGDYQEGGNSGGYQRSYNNYNQGGSSGSSSNETNEMMEMLKAIQNDMKSRDQARDQKDEKLDKVKEIQKMAQRDGRPPWSMQIESLPSKISTGLQPSLVFKKPAHVSKCGETRHIQMVRTKDTGKGKGIASSSSTAARPNKRRNVRLQDESEEEEELRVTWRQNRKGTIDIIEGTQHSHLPRHPLAQQHERFNQLIKSLDSIKKSFQIQ